MLLVIFFNRLLWAKMPVCENCDGQEFVLQDGLYYCVVCSVQSQDVVEQFVDDYDAAAFAAENRTKSAPKSKRVVDRGRPWYTAEAFQVRFPMLALLIVVLRNRN